MNKSETFVVSEGTDSRGYWSILNTETTVYEETAFVDRPDALEAVRLLNKRQITMFVLETALEKNGREINQLWDDVQFALQSLVNEADSALSFLASDDTERVVYRVECAESHVKTLTQLRQKKVTLDQERAALLAMQHDETKSAKVLS